MPQMAPLNWLSLFTIFMMIFMLTNSLNFYTFLCLNKASAHSGKASIKLVWKWL
uniref:ATP synthase F0 subunit 8 n=1 Tax=Meloe proscarabaeus TaxID=34751 RepID=UPI0022382675|nr:ATP synthase F0 subunit 8 [Meloe proscarabaeus]UYA96970.1 ATP synthase F0 subunit 8 [Meloe proscarabaeus]